MLINLVLILNPSAKECAGCERPDRRPLRVAPTRDAGTRPRWRHRGLAGSQCEEYARADAWCVPGRVHAVPRADPAGHDRPRDTHHRGLWSRPDGQVNPTGTLVCLHRRPHTGADLALAGCGLERQGLAGQSPKADLGSDPCRRRQDQFLCGLRLR